MKLTEFHQELVAGVITILLLAAVFLAAGLAWRAFVWALS